MSRRDTEVHLASEARGHNWAIPVPGKRDVEVLKPVAVLPAAGAYSLTGPLDVRKTRLLHLYLSVNAAAIGNIVSIVPEVSMDPKGSEDSFFVIGVSDGSVAIKDLAVAPSTVYTKNNFGTVQFVPMNIVTPKSITATDKLRMSVSIEVSSACWIRFRVAEASVTATPASLGVSYAKSV